MEKEVKENFCGACLAIPLAFTGAGIGTYGSSRKNYKNSKKMQFWGFFICLISLLVMCYFYFRKCNSCR